MKTSSVVVGTLLLIFIKIRITQGQQLQRIREGRCPPIRRRTDCPAFVWDECTCDSDCSGKQKCCLDGCKYACLDPDEGTPSVRNKADVVFIMDSSGSIGPDDYNREKQFVKDLTNVFQVSPTEARISTIIYSDDPKLIFDFDTFNDKQSINTAIDDLEYLGNRTRIDKALAMAMEVFSKSRPAVPRIAFVLTDGKQTDDYDAKPLDIAVRPLHDLGVHVYVIGIGTYVDPEELRLLARRQEDVFTVDSFELLLQQTYRIVNRIDTYDAIPPLEITADIMFLVDSSSAIPRATYGDQLNFLQTIVNQFRISPRYVRASVISYGNSARLSIPFGTRTTNAAMNRSIDSLPYVGGQKRIDRALWLANQTFLQARRLVPKILLILTHGGQLADVGTNLRLPVKALRDQGVSIFAIAIGDGVDYSTLNYIVENDNLIVDKSYKSLEPYLPPAASYIRVKSDFSTPLSKDAAVVFLVDTSEEVETMDFKRQREFVISLAKAFEISEEGVRASVITYGKYSRPTVQFKDSSDVDKFINAMIRTSQIKGRRMIDQALLMAARMFRHHDEVAPRAVILFTSGPHAGTLDQLKSASKRVTDLGALIYVVAIGPSVANSQIEELVSSSDDIKKLPSFMDLQSEIHFVGRYVSLQQVPGPGFIADVVFLIDASFSVGVVNFRRQKDFVKAVAQALNFGEQATRASLVVYSSTTTQVTDFNSHRTLGRFNAAVDGAPYLRRGRRVDTALTNAARLLSRARPGIPRVTVLITSGRRDLGTPLKDISRQLELVGAKSFVVTIGALPDLRDYLVLSKQEDILRLQSFVDLPRKQKSFSQHIISSFDVKEPTPTPTPTPTPSTPPDKISLNFIADVIFIMDSSSSVSSRDYSKEKEFVKYLATYLKVSPGNSRAALITYGNAASEVIEFDIKRLRADFESAVEKAPFVGRNRRIDRALEKASQMMANARPWVRKIVILLTSGKQSRESGSKTPGEAAIPLLDKGVYNYVVAIGQEPDISELRPVVQQPAQIFRMTSFDDLEPRKTTVGGIIVETSTGPLTDIIADIIFILDSSNDVTRDEYNKEKSFIKEFARYLNVAPGKSRAAVITYGQSSDVLFKYGGYDSLTVFDVFINRASYIGGTQRMDLALDDAGRLLSEAKLCIPRWVILLTAGRHLSDPRVKSLLQASKPVRDQSDKVYVVAIGNKPDPKELKDIVKDPKDIFSVGSFQSLKSQARVIATTVANRSDVDLCVIKTFQATIVFLVDTTSSIGTLDFRRQKKFVKSVAKSFNVCQDSSQAAIITYGSLTSQKRPTDIYKDLSAFEQAVDKSQYMGGLRRLHLAIDTAEQLLRTVSPSQKRIVVILTGGQPLIQDALSLKQSFKTLRNAGNGAFIVAIGNNYDKDEFLPAVDWPEDIFSVSSFDNLLPRACSISKAIANRTDTDIPRDFMADVIFIMDSSADVSRADYEKEKDFIESLAGYLRLSSGRTRAAVLTYGYTTTLVAEYDSYETLQTFNSAVDGASYIGGNGRLDYALEYASRQLIDTSRQLVPKIVLLLTAGRLSPDQSLRLSAQPLHDYGFKVFIAKIGDKPDVNQLLPTVKDEAFVISVPSFDGLSRRALPVAQKLSKHTDPELPADFPGADVLFMVDSSSDISSNNYEKQKDLVKNLIRTLDSFSSKSRISFITYGNRPRVVYGLDNNMNSEAQQREIDSVQPMGGRRRIDRALEEAVRMMQNSRPDVPKIILLVAAGKQIEQNGVQPLSSYGTALQRLGVDAFVLGIGKDIEHRDLGQVVRDAKNVFLVQMFQSLNSIDRQLAYEIVTRTVDGMIETDVIFVMDSSSEVSQSDYRYEKEAVKSMARSLKVPSGQSRASVITYGNFPSPVVKFDGYKSFPAFENFIDRAQRIGGRRRIDLALKDAGKLLREARPSVRQNVILLTSGRTHPLSRDLYVSAQRIFGNNADLLVIAVGRRPNFKELTAIVQKPKHVYNVSSFSDLRRKSNEITKIVSQMPDKPTIYNNFVADIVFLMDSSLTVEQKVYDRQKNFIKSMVRSLNLSTDKSRVAVVNYGGDSVEVFRFSSPQDVAAIENRVDNARRVGRKRDIAKALQFSASLLEKSRPDVSKVIIFLTSGSELYLMSPSQVLRDYGADRYVIAIGSDLDEEELTPIIDEPRDMFTMRTPPELTWKTEYIIDEIIKRTVTRTSVLPLDFDADVLFLVDSSSDVSQENYNREKNFVKSLAFILNLKPGKTRAAVVIYGNFARTVIRFTDYASPSSFFRRIDTLPFLRGRRRLDSALIEGGSVLDTARPSADKVAILLTAGRHTQEVGAPPLNQAVESIRSHNAKLFVVAIGQRVDETELRPLTREPIVVSGFNVLIRNSIRIAKDIKNITDQTDVPKSPGADIVFLVDSSSGVTEDNFTKEKAFVTSLAKQLNFGSDKTRVGIISYSDYATLAARFDVVKNEENLQRLLDGIRRLQRGRRIDRGLIRAAQLFGESRPNVRQVLVLLTSGRHTSNVENPFRDAVQRLKTKGVDRFVVAIGPNPDPELTAVVERREDVISVFSFDSLQPQVIPIARHIKEERIPPGFKADIIFLIDSAFEVTTNNFNKQKEFIKDLSAFLNLSSRGSRVAIILYASSPSLKMALGTLETPESLSRGLDRLAPLTGTRRMDRALEFASLKFDNKRPQAVRKIVVLFASGKQAGGGKPLNEAVKRLQEINAETYVVAIGSQVSESELQPVVSRRNDIIRVPSFDILASKVKPVADQIINGSRPIPPEFKSDILFIMDSSSPVSRDDFQTQKDVVKSIMKSFHVRRGQSRAAVITYGRYSEKLLRFNSSLSLNDIESVVDTATSIGGSPRIDEVLVDAADVLRDAIQSIPRIVIMFTTVRDLTDRHRKAVDKAAEVIHDTGARVYVIAFGKDVDDLSLKKLADSQEDIFKVPTIKDLNDSMAVEIFRRVELPKPVVPMDFTGDVIFLVDSSSEVSEEQFKKEKHFVASLAKTLNLRPAKTRGSAITYGRYALVGIEFNDHPNPAMFEQALQGLYPIGYERRMDKALQKSVDMVKVARSYVPKIVVLLTAGRQSSPRNTLPQSVKSLKDHGTSVFVVGIGSRPDSQELRAIVEEPGDVLRVSQFNDFSPSRTRQIARHIVSRTENRTLDVDADIVFLLDASSFVSRENFVKEKDFVKSMAKVLNVAPGSSRAAVILIGTFPDTKVTFNEYRTLRDFNELVDKAQSFGGSRRIDRALEEASKVLVDRRRGVPHVVVLVTGGKQSESGNNIPFENAVKPLDKIGAHTFVVAIGHDPDTLKNVLPVPSFNDLQSRVYKMARQIKTTSEPKPANISADIIFLMDSSTSVDRGGFDKQKNFVKSLAKYFNVSPRNSRATVVAYGNTTRTVVKFSDYQSETNFNDMLDRQPWIGGDRRIDRALRTAESIMRQARSEVPKILILLTAGRQPRSPDVTPIGIAAQPLRNMGIKNIVVSVGSEIDRKDLLGMVQSSDDIFSVALFDDLRYEVQPVVKYAVNFFELPIFDIKAEVLFLLDASDQTGRENFEKQKTFIKLLARSLNVSPGKSTAALIAYSTIATINIPLGSYNTVQEFERNVDRTRFLGNSRKMYRALEEAAYLFQNATESDAERKVILITGGRQTSDEDEEPLEKFKKLLLDVGALPFIVAIGKDHDNQTLRAVVEDPGDIFRVPTFIELSSSVSSTAARVANRKAPPIIQDEYIIFLMDSSSTVQREQFQRQKNFIKSLAEYLQVGSSDKTKAAVINYGSVPSGIITFDDYTNIRGFKSGIDGIIPVRGSRRIDQALGEAAVILRGIDQSSKKILVLLTAGQQAKESDVTPLDVAIRPIRDMKSHMYVVALGNDPSTPELRPLVTKLEDMFRVPFNFMERIVPSIVDHIRKENPYPGPTHDVVFLMDTSDVSRSDFYQEILFVKSLARELSVTASEFQKAVVSYGNKYSQVVRFDSYDSLRDFYTAIDASVYQAGARRMDRAFEAASMILSSRNPASKKTVVLLTGGSNSREADPNSLARSVQPLFKMEATVIVLAFGNRYDVQELLPTVKHPKDVRPVPQAYDLVRYVSEISKRIINGPDEPKTPKMDADILFIMDSSYEVNQEEYKSEKDFIKSLIRSLNVSLDTSRAALISYGDLGSLNSRFIGLKSLSDFDKLVDNATYVGGERRIDRALEKSTQILNEARAGSSKFVIFLTSGRQASSGKPLDEVVGPLRENGVKTYVITIGKKSDAQELRPLVASPEDLVSLHSFKELNSQISKIASHISEKAVCLRPDYILDVVFLMDTSTEVDDLSLDKEKAFVKLLAKCLNVSPGKSRASVITFGTTTSREIDFNSYESTQVFESLVDRISSIGGDRRIDKALEAAAEVVENSPPSVPKLVVLLTSGPQPANALSFSEAAIPLHSIGAMFYIVSIANDLDKKYYEALVDHPSQVSQASSFGSLNYVLPKVTQGVEQGASSRMHLNADVVFLMDASTAENTRYFQSQKDLIKSIARSIGSSPAKLRASLVIYSSSTTVLASLNSYTNLQRFEIDVDRAPYLRGTRRMDFALAAAALQLSQSRPNAAKIVILITTGLQAQVVGMTPLDEASKPLREANANIYVIGIGKQPDLRELVPVTNNPVKIIPTPDRVIVNLHLWLRQLRQQVNNEKESPLIYKADLIFLLDSSNDVSTKVFKEQKDFIKSIVGKFLIASNKTRVAVVSYSSRASSVITFSTFDNLLDLFRGIDSIRYIGGIRRMDAALKEANKLRETARSDVPIYVIFLTAGRQASTAVSTPLDRAAQPILDSTARMFVVGIGSRPEEMELFSMVERSRDVFRFPSEKMKEEVPLFVINMASQTGATVPRDFKADILFLVDSSQTISKRKFLQELEFVKAFARKFDVSPEKSRVGVITFGNTPILSIRFEDYGNILSFSEGVNRVPYQGGQKSLNNALVFAARVLDLSKTRPKADKILVLLTDGQQPLGYDPKEGSVEALRQLGVHINVIGAGGNVSMQELRKLTLSPDDLFYSRTFDALILQAPIVFKRTMNVVLSHHQLQHGVFLLESSLFRTRGEFESQINFVKSIAKRLQVSPTGTRAGVILYGDEPKLSIGLNDYSTLPELYNLLDNLAHESGGRQLHKALTLAGETLQKSPQEIPKFVVVILEGQQYSSGSLLLRDAVKPLQALGVTIYVVGIGEKLNRQELYTMVQTSRYIIQVPRFTELLRQMEFIAYRIETTITDPCHETLDVGFVIDASGSVGMDPFSREKNFVKLVSRRFAATSPNTRLGLLVFSDTPKLFVDFADYESKTIEQFQANVAQATFQDGRSRIDLALRAASQDFFTNRRSGVPRVLILVSDGRQSEDPGYYPLATAVKPLQAQRVRIVGVGFGDSVDVENLKEITGSKDRILLDQEINDIDRLQMELVSKACEV